MSRALAVLGPLVVSVALGAAYLAPAPPTAQPESTEVIDQKLAKAQPELVVVGNSATHIAIDGGLVAKGLGVRGTYATLKDSTAPTWFALLKYRVYGQGFRPARVIVAGPEGALTAVTPSTTHDLEYLLELAGTGDRDLVDRVSGPSALDALLFRVWAHRATWRRTAVDQASRGVAEALLGSFSRRRSEHLFVAVDRDPVAGLDVGEVEGDGVDRPVADTFLPALVDLTAQYGSELVVVRIPARAEAGRTERTDRGQRIAEYLAGRGVRYVDQLGAGITADQYQDGYHMTGPGRLRFTRELVEALRWGP